MTLRYGSISLVIIIIIMLSYLSVENNFNSFRSVVAQQQKQNSTSVNTNTTTPATGNQSDTFQAKGQINSLASNIFLGKSNSINPNIWILGGNWQFSVKNGN